MNCCVMPSLKFDICLMHMFEIFKLEFMACFDLNSIEKIKRKGIRNFRINEKAKQHADPLPSAFRPNWPSSPAPARALALSARWVCPVGANSLNHTPTLCAAGPTYQRCCLFQLTRLLSTSLVIPHTQSLTPQPHLSAPSSPQPPLCSSQLPTPQ
jgi:hypothetical protein